MLNTPVEDVEHTFLMVEHAIVTGSLSDHELGRIVVLDVEKLGDISIAVFDSADRVVAISPSFADRDKAWFAALHSTDIKPSTFAQPVQRDAKPGLLFVRESSHGAGKADMRIAIVIPVGQSKMAGAELPPGSAALLLDRDNREIARYPSLLANETGSVYPVDAFKGYGPTSSTYYAISAQDGRDLLKTIRAIPVGDSGDYWVLELDYAVDAYRSSWLHSLYLDLLGMATEVILLTGGIVMLRRESRLNKNIETWSGFVSSVVRNIPTPVALVDVETGKIRLANEALEGVFGDRAQAGESFSTLFADPARWIDTGVRDTIGPVAMLTCAGPVQMMVRSTRFLGHAIEADHEEFVLVTLLDVSEQCAQISQLREEADFDPLTGLANRRHFERAAAQAVALAQRHQTPVAVLGLDLDHFKRVNDTWGHAAGDQVLVAVAQLFTASLRDHDLPARMGGEEFAAILPGTDAEQACSAAERIRVAVQSTPVVLDDGQVVHITVSIGGAMYRPGEADLQEALKRADAALYTAKQSGRNRIEMDVHDDGPGPPQDGGDDRNAAEPAPADA